MFKIVIKKVLFKKCISNEKEEYAFESVNSTFVLFHNILQEL
jgi:hypothetical protein